MIPQAADFKAESQALYDLLSKLDASRYSESTQFKDWTINGVLQHLHYWNIAANLSLIDEPRFMVMLKDTLGKLGAGVKMRDFENDALDGLSGQNLLDTWYETMLEVAENFANADPKTRLKWAGPDMSATSSISARLMETWAHGQEVYDHFGVERVNTDGIKNIAHLGINTFGYTYAVREKTAPENKPYVKLRAPSGETWEWNTPNEDNFISGEAGEFCQVVTQVRNIADTDLTVVGDVATQWMSIAQCFAGGAETPPAPGTRFIKKTTST
jgi:uncharacterized protein (TIGR03084 family)